MKILKVKSILFSLLAMMAIAVLVTSCSKEEADIRQDVATTTETLTYRLSIPEGITPETTAEWLDQLSEEEIEEYLIDDLDMITSRSCGSWGAWSSWRYYSSSFTCFSLSCPNSQSQKTDIQRRFRHRECSWGTECQFDYKYRSTCRPPC